MTASPPSTTRRSLTIGLVIGKLVLAGFLLWLVTRKLDWQALQDNFLHLSPWSLLAMQVLVFCKNALLAWRWQVVTAAMGYTLAYRSAFTGSLIAIFFAQGLPASIGGDAFRLWWLRRVGMPLSEGGRNVLFDRILGFVSLLIMVGIGLLILGARLLDAKLIIALAVVVGLGLLGAIALASSVRLGISRRVRAWGERSGGKVGAMLCWLVDLREMFLVGRSRPLMALAILTTSCATHLMTVCIGWLTILDVGATVDFADCFAAISIALLPAYLPVSIAGWGVREASMVALFALVGVASSLSLLISLAIGTSILVASLLGGVIWLVSGYRKAYDHTTTATEVA